LFVIVMAVFGTTAPDSSATVPRMIPVGAWQYAAIPASMNAKSSKINTDFTVDMIVSPLIC
jgi:hypothetical protein